MRFEILSGLQKKCVSPSQLILVFLAALACYFINAAVAAFQAQKGVSTEIIHHSTLLIKLQSEGALYSIWYMLEALISLGSHDRDVLIASGYLLLGMVFLFKGGMVAAILANSGKGIFLEFLISVLLFVAVPVMVPGYVKYAPGFLLPANYIGDIPSNTFMSATQHVANAFAIPCVFFVGKYFFEPSLGRLISAGVFSILAVLAKPGIAPGVLMMWGLGVLVNLHARRLGRSEVFAVFLVFLLISLDVYWIYERMLSGAWLKIATVIAPFATWTYYTAHPFFDLFRSWLFPISLVFSIFVFRDFDRESVFLLGAGWVVSICSVLPFAVLAESRNGGLVYPGNYIWGAIAATAALYFNSAYVLVRKSYRIMVIPLLFLIWSALSGVKYLMDFYSTKSYL